MNNTFTRLVALAAVLGGLVGNSLAGPIPKPDGRTTALSSISVVGEPPRTHAAVPVEDTSVHTATAAPANTLGGEGEGTVGTTGRSGYN